MLRRCYYYSPSLRDRDPDVETQWYPRIVSYMNIYETGAYSVDSTRKIEIRASDAVTSQRGVRRITFPFYCFWRYIYSFFHGPINNGNADVSKEQNVRAAYDVYKRVVWGGEAERGGSEPRFDRSSTTLPFPFPFPFCGRSEIISIALRRFARLFSMDVGQLATFIESVHRHVFKNNIPAVS